jgi:hypothetical protein
MSFERARDTHRLLKGTVMQMRSFGARLALVATMVLPLVSCQQFYELRATKVFMDANTQYERADYVAAAEMYE